MGAKLAEQNTPQGSSGDKPEQIPLWLDFVFFLIKFLVIAAVVIGAIILAVYAIPFIVAFFLIIGWYLNPPWAVREGKAQLNRLVRPNQLQARSSRWA